jgi:hypothetical protein
VEASPTVSRSASGPGLALGDVAANPVVVEVVRALRLLRGEYAGDEAGCDRGRTRPRGGLLGRARRVRDLEAADRRGSDEQPAELEQRVASAETCFLVHGARVPAESESELRRGSRLRSPYGRHAAVETFGLSGPCGRRTSARRPRSPGRAGEVFGYLGPSAGKSTTIRAPRAHPPHDGRASSTGCTADGVRASARGLSPGDLRLADQLTGASSSSPSRDCAGRRRCGCGTALRALRHRSRPADPPALEGQPPELGLAGLHPRPRSSCSTSRRRARPCCRVARSCARRRGGAVFLPPPRRVNVADRVGIIRTGRLVDVDAVEPHGARSARGDHVRAPVDAAS